MSMNNSSSDTNSTEEVADLTSGWRGFASNLFTNAIIGTVILVLFYFLRIFYRNFYNARIIKSNGAASQLVVNPLEWIKYTYIFPLESIFESRGIDAYMHLRFLLLCIQLISIFLVFGIGILLPINYTSNNSDLTTHNVTLNELDSVSIASIPEGSNRLWAHTISIPFFTAISFFLFKRTYIEYLEKRIRWMSKHHERNYTVLVREMSKSIKTADDMRNFFQNFYSSKDILACHMVYKEPELRKLWNQHRATQRKLDRILSEMEIKGTKPVRAKGWRPAFLGGDYEDAREYYEKKLMDVDFRLKQAQREACQTSGGGSLPPTQPPSSSSSSSFLNEGSDVLDSASSMHNSDNWRISNITPSNLMKWANKTSTSGFITFSRMAYASICASNIYSKNSNKFIVTPAPEFKNIKWKNLTMTKRERTIRRIIVSIVFFILFCFWTIPVTAISAVSKLENLAKVPVLNWLVSAVELNDYLQGIVEGYLPSLALVAFMGLLPLIIRLLVIVNKEYSKTMLYHKIFTTYWAFLVVNVFIVVTISGSVMSVLFRVLENLTLKEIITLFGSSLPTQSSFFINYILVQSLTSVPFDIVRPIELLVGIIRAARETSPGEKIKALSRDDPLQLTSVKYARELLILVITLSYSTLSPFILPFGLLYFLIDYYVSKYNHIYSFCPKYQSGGTIFPLVFNRLCIGLAIYQLTAVGIFLLKAFIPGVVISLPFPFITLFYWWINIHRYKRPSSVLPLNICPEEDFIGTDFIKSYEDPVLSVNSFELSRV